MPTQPFYYRNEELYCEGASIAALARQHDTPLYVYSADEVKRRVALFKQAFRKIEHTICYSVKANSNLTLLRMLAKLGCGFDIVSGGELERVRIAAPGRLRNVVFSGVGKQLPEIDAGIKAGILIFNIESVAELELLSARATSLRRKVRIAFRVNPDVNAETHPYISTGLSEHKFGVDIAKATLLYAHAAQNKWLDVAGISVHIGSQITSASPFGAALRRVHELVVSLRSVGHNIRFVDAGGGLGVSYTSFPHGETATDDFEIEVNAYAREIGDALGELRTHLLLEPGRAIIAHAGALISRVVYLKENGSKKFVILDAAMNDLIRPSLYQAHHEIIPVKQANIGSLPETVDVVGPICETGDFFARDRRLTKLEPGDLVALLDAGAYGMSLASNYNSRTRAAEVLVDGKRAKLVRKRESLRDLLRSEIL